ncbi:MAG: WYL domain-containing protein, partial [Actinomycetota bacterium]|nr:WYL domain-containing protein [Actinomycetota bacterium]
ALGAVQHAVFAGRRLRLNYSSGRSGGEARWRTVDPVGLVEAAGRWYLLATHDGEDRTYRVSRISGTEELDEPAQRPEGVDLERLWLRRREEFRARRHGVRVRLRLPDARREELAMAGVDVRDTGAAGEADAVFGDLRHAARTLWPHLPDVEVLGPPELRRSLRERAEASCAMHTSTSDERPSSWAVQSLDTSVDRSNR